MTRPKSFAAIKSFSVEDLRPYLGTYVNSMADTTGSALMVAFLTFLAGLIGFTLWDSMLPTVVIASLLATIGLAFVVIDSRTVRIIGPDRIEYRSPVPGASWSATAASVEKCDLVPGSPHNRLRVHEKNRSHTMPLNSRLWKLLKDADLSYNGQVSP